MRMDSHLQYGVITAEQVKLSVSELPSKVSETPEQSSQDGEGHTWVTEL